MTIETPDLKPILHKLALGSLLTSDEAKLAFEIILSGEASEGQIGAFLMALRCRGETLDDIYAGASVMRAYATRVNAPAHAIDTCGTGGDQSGSYNISTAVALVAAASNIPVAKHGNRALSSKSGSSQVLECLGVRLDLTASQIEDCLNQVSIGFLFAPNHHAAMRHVGKVRQELGTRTIFNLLGPLTNPAGAKRQLLGVFSQEWLEPMAQTLKRLGSHTAWVVHGSDGMDEITTTGPSDVAILKNGHITRMTIHPSDFGIPLSNHDALVGGTPEENAQALKRLLEGETGAYRDIVLLNSAAAFVIAEQAADLSQGIKMAQEIIDSGAAATTLKNLIAFSQDRAQENEKNT